MEQTIYNQVVQANIELHSKLSEHYNTCEPHFRPENIAKVEANLKKVIDDTQATKMLDLGCGTGFMINIGKKYVKEIWGVDVTKAMTDRIDKSGDCEIVILNEDTAQAALPVNYFDVATAYSFLHHLYDIKPTLHNAYNSLKEGGKFYADLDPNYYFWEGVNKLDRNSSYDFIVKREIEAVTYKDEDIEKTFGVSKDIFNNAEFGKNIKGGFKEEDLISMLKAEGFKEVSLFYHWYIGQGALINDTQYSVEDRFKYADVMHQMLQKALPLSKNLFKYIGFVATK
ncbi:MAG: class I SAM-dependent methyltransferase [Thermoflexibacter sp.]|jgi:ubiquinone/menaquinone biosynthesis C-methylase UbiE|nr:class I SAM-dependent methyltransferase [Thermoflexibacter sp.]